jgi:prepilin-type processing-associated H-X9-DG protein
VLRLTAAAALIAVLVARAGTTARPRSGTGVGVGVASALDKLRPGDPVPEAHAIDLAAARGECESAQIAIRSERPLAALRARVGQLEGPSAAVTPSLYRVANVELASPSGPEGAPGPWPDPLVPERDPFFGEPRAAFPVAVPAGTLQAIWVEVCVPAGARPGRYRGEVRLSDGDREIAAVPLALEVWPFVLPATSTFTVTFGLPTRTGTRALGKPDDPELARALAAAALRHRVSPHGLSYDPPWGRCTAQRCDLDFTPYDAEMAPILDGTLVPGVRGTFADMRVTAADWSGSDADLVALLRAWRKHFDARGWSGTLWLYTLDEPKPQDLPELARRARAARAAGVRVFVTSVPVRALDGLVDAYAPNVFFFDGHVEELRGQRPARLGPPPGEPFWYASCMSHGCDELPTAGAARRRMIEEFRGWPGYEIDRPGAAVRAMAWLAFRQRIAGELYYDMLQAWSGDPWKNVRAFAGNGDGTLLYPGLPSRWGGQHPFPVESIRLKIVRDGMEDRELLALAERNGLSALAARLAARLAPSVRGFARDPAAYLAAHRELGRALAAVAPP